MKLTISKNANPNYLAKIVRIESFRPHPNADRMKLATVDGCTISTGINSEPGLFIYFPVECQISHDYLSKNNLYRNHSLNEANDPANVGFFEETRRVKCINLRGLASEGLIMPLASICSYLKMDEMLNVTDIVGTEFDTINDELFVKKYVVQKTPGAPGSKKDRNQQKKSLNIVEDQFRFHIDTQQLKKNLFKFQTDTQIHISHKFHGTSAIFCNLLVHKTLSPWQKFLKLIGGNIVESEYKIFCSSRKVVKDPTINKGLQQGYYKCDIWNIALEVIKPFLQKGMTIYAEIVGYMPDGSIIQKGYDYGCVYDPSTDYSVYTPQQMYESNLFKIYVYRITQTNIDGKMFEMSARNLQQYCQAKGLCSVIEDFYGTVFDFVEHHCTSPYMQGLTEGSYEEHFLDCLVNRYLERECGWCKNKVPAEGVVVRIDQPNFEAYKLKSLAFLTYETKMLDEGVADIESDQSDDN